MNFAATIFFNQQPKAIVKYRVIITESTEMSTVETSWVVEVDNKTQALRVASDMLNKDKISEVRLKKVSDVS